MDAVPNAPDKTMPAYRLAAAALAAIAWIALGLQFALALWLVIGNGRSVLYGVVFYFGFFTILTNLGVAITCTAGAAHGLRSRAYAPSIVGCMTTAIVVVGLAYHFLLRMLWAPEGAQWLADTALHYVVPIGAVLHWFAYPHSTRLRASAPLFWCVYPVAYFAYALLRGALLHEYPYPFIDAAALGYGGATLNAIGLLAVFIVIGYLVRAIANTLARRVTRAAAR